MLRHIPFREAEYTRIDEKQFQSEIERLLEAYPERQTEIELLNAFQVWRQDDNGNSFEVNTPTSERDAKCLVQHFESLGHKQTYWYTRVT